MSLKNAFRLFRRRPGYTLINVAGLGVGLAATTLIALFVIDELRYDRYHEAEASIIRVTELQLDEAGSPTVHRVLIDPPIGPGLVDDLPEVLEAARLTPVGPLLANEDRKVSCEDCYFADQSLFRVLTLPLSSGNASQALVAPFTVVLSQSLADRLFGDVDPLGRTLIANGDTPYTVTGVFAPPPGPSHLTLEAVLSMSSLERMFGPLQWDSPNYATYLKLAHPEAAEGLEEKANSYLARNRDALTASRSQLRIQRLRDIHLRSSLVGELGPNGDIRFVRLFVAVALVILLVAGINFVNLTTARATVRAREVGVRKVAGASRARLVSQFLAESVVQALAGLVLAIGLVELALPAFAQFSGKEVQLLQGGPVILAALVATGTLVGLVAGIAPALLLSSFSPVAALSGRIHRGPGGGRLRAALVSTQFAVAIILGIATSVVFRQLSFVETAPLGYDPDNIIVMPTAWEYKEHFDPVRERLMTIPEVVSVSQSNPVPGGRLFNSFESWVEDEAQGQLRSASLYPVWADNHFAETFGIEFLAGRNFYDELASASGTGFLVNRTGAERLGFAAPNEAVDKPLRVGGWRGSILGVVADFHFESMHEEIPPMVFYMDERNYRALSIRLTEGASIERVATALENEWARFEPDQPVSFVFQDDRIRAAYTGETRLGQLLGVFSGLALMITCLGVFGLAAFAAERRRKEMGVRRTLGATTGDLLALSARGVLALVVGAFVFAAPAGWFAMTRWLDAFAYHASIPVWLALAVGAACTLVALVTVSYHTLRVARVSLSESLRCE